MKPSNPYFLGISGGSASGKTYLLKKILARYPKGKITRISTDNYYLDRELLPRDAEGEINFDHPSALNLDQLAADLARIEAGETVSMREYTFNNPDAVPGTIHFEPAPIILLEGLFVFYHPGIMAKLDLKIFVEAAEYVRLARRINRDKERGYETDEVLKMYTKYVAPMYQRYVEPFKNDCDLIVPNNDRMDHAVEVIAHHLDWVLSQQ